MPDIARPTFSAGYVEGEDGEVLWFPWHIKRSTVHLLVNEAGWYDARLALVITPAWMRPTIDGDKPQPGSWCMECVYAPGSGCFLAWRVEAA